MDAARDRIARLIADLKWFASAHSRPRADDPLANFRPERSRFSTGRRSAVAVAMIVLIGVPVLMRGRAATRAAASTASGARSAAPAETRNGSARFTSQPSGADVVIDGTRRGATPLSLALPIGRHTVEIRSGALSRTTTVEIESGTLMSHDVDLGAAATQRGITGGLDVASQPAGTPLAIDGTPHGSTPQKISNLAPGVHVVQFGKGAGIVRRSVTITSGTMATLFVTMGDQTSGGWVSAKSTIPLEIREDGQIVGTTSADRLMLPVGRHDLEFVNTDLEFQADRTVQVASGKTTPVAIDLPKGSLSVNALPWAEVFVDGRAVGTTPIANLPVPIGSHAIVWKHPQLGEVRRTVTVAAKSPARVGVELKQ